MDNNRRIISYDPNTGAPIYENNNSSKRIMGIKVTKFSIATMVSFFALAAAIIASIGLIIILFVEGGRTTDESTSPWLILIFMILFGVTSFYTFGIVVLIWLNVFIDSIVQKIGSTPRAFINIIRLIITICVIAYVATFFIKLYTGGN